jgi:hypothetical protein
MMGNQRTGQSYPKLTWSYEELAMKALIVEEKNPEAGHRNDETGWQL